ncbi:FtsK/SpoIIIE domain-containing protein [Staphylococcus pseudintermedius]|uniref:DNA translocase FtsK n=1 Tax=Staphylococcus pseudintermedius TaxID=283734 RepID=UPI001BDE4E6D|nr:DNA translocase FtsK [Staphylococcus pseudintermedius]UAR95901.1 FtsK/SpoIIIE domain-containing protein [Staphylococcus pseudintermedius]UAR99888.1 FtsK/SpoIIIE domain-containing protein [Staphylococcus pseudintermedius]UAS14801.1 FtsK/SpoIIIE domain-containing protein [Staphylococcus pseudintermedius]UAS19252.1 FtsK/SpoIIIE domain-containing protein [Staphylococcus pseudintermedius]UAS31824.1 FtsK/SpoIIIE domain-containing protein [Staphylococcus pseudintermedius]
MSWFDQLFGENDKDQSSQRSTRRRKSEATREEKHASFVQQSQDVYQRPRGKFRFPIEMHDEVVERHHQQADTTQTQDVTMHTQLHERRPSFTVDRQHRRHRGVQQARCYGQQQTRGSNSTHSNSHQNDYTFAAQSSQHSKKPKRHRDDIVAKPNYHQKPFQASEVPSAIFGTKQPKKIENSGLNQPPGARKAMPQLQKNERVVQEATPQAESTTTRQNRTTERSGTSKSPTRRHNTIHIENIYASQIVEEIRREREKKMLQKKNFKEALKKKRESYEQHANPDIQKAIDEMYSAQARQLLGDQYTESTDETISEDLLNEETVDATTEQNKDATTLTSNFEYEEVDLSEVESENHDESDSSTNEEIAENELDIEALSFEDESGISQVEDAQQHRDTHAHTTTSDETTANKVETDASDIEFEVVEVDDDNALDDMITDETDGERIDSEIESDSVDVDIEDEDVNEQQGQQVGSMPKLEPELKPELVQSNEALEKSVEKVTPQQNDTVTAEQLSEATEVSQQTEQPKPYKVPIRKGSKPFNVVMTPSDKKKLMSRQQQAKKEEATVQPTPRATEQPVRPVQPVEQQSSSQLTTQHVHNETQTGDSQQPQSQQEVKTIRRGPNLKLPSLDLLEAPEEQEQDENWIAEKKEELNNAFYYFNVPAEVVNVVEGPSVTRFELSVERGVKVSRITALQDDIKMALAAKDIRIEAPIPGTSLVGIEVPNPHTTKVNISSILSHPAFKNAESKLTVAMGNRINNEPLLMDIAKTPHALIAGATGSGKSVSINSILISLLYRNHPEELRLLLIDPKMVELAPYNGLPHLVAPVITDVKAATQSLKWAVDEMERRFKLFAHHHVRNISAFNNKVNYDQRIPKIVIVIDELADLMMMAPQDVEQSIARLAQKARACGIHMLVATQRPSVNVITGLIKANIPTRIAFMVSSSVDSRTILDSGGAERLLGYGDMLYLGSGMNKPIRVQGTFVSDEEIDQVVEFIRAQREPEYLFQEKELLEKNDAPSRDELFDEVCQFMVREQHISTSLIQRHFQIGYNRAARIIDQLEQLGYISGANGSKPRDVYLTESELSEL